MSNFRPTEFIAEKQAGKPHSSPAIKEFIDSYIAGDIPDYQVTAWLMAVYFKGMTFEETAALTDAMIHSGSVAKHAAQDAIYVDKHSTGGVGDKITLILAPVLAALDLYVPTITGRGLGFTGGTLDKFETIPGMNTALTLEEFEAQTAELKLAFGAQTRELVPADQRIYALRDVTSTVRSLPLITSSILSKKVAEGINNIVFDVKCGYGAFMETVDEARELSNWLVSVAARFNVNAAALITNMNSPLGYEIGNWNEVVESVNVLNGSVKAGDLLELTRALAGVLLMLSDRANTLSGAYDQINRVISNGDALKKLLEAVSRQGGDSLLLDPLVPVHEAATSQEILSDRNGYVHGINAREIGLSSVSLGAGRRIASDDIDPSAGITLAVKPGEKVKIGQALATISAASDEVVDKVKQRVLDAFSIHPDPNEAEHLIFEMITPSGTFSWDKIESDNSFDRSLSLIHI